MFARKTGQILLVGLWMLTLLGCGEGVRAGGGTAVAPFQTGSETMPRIISVNSLGIASARPDVALLQLDVGTVDKN